MRKKGISSTLIGFLFLTLIGLVLLYQMTPLFKLDKFKEKPQCVVKVEKYSVANGILTLTYKEENCESLQITIVDPETHKDLCSFEEQPVSPLTLDLTGCSLTAGNSYEVYINGKQAFTFYYVG